MPYLSIRFHLDPLDPDAAEAACFAAGAVSVTLTDQRDDAVLEPAPGEVRLWPATRLEALFTQDTASAHTIAKLAAALGVPAANLEVTAVAGRGNASGSRTSTRCVSGAACTCARPTSASMPPVQSY